MAYPDYIRLKAIEMRVQRGLTIDEIAERLAIPRTTIYYWVRDLPLPEYMTKPRKLAQVRAAEATRTKWKARRDEAYALGVEQWPELEQERTFREFVTVYIAEGYKRDRNMVAVANSDERVIVLAKFWMLRLADRKLTYHVQHHADQQAEDLRAFWGRALDVQEEAIKLLLKSNSGQLGHRTWRCVNGVMTVRTSDTMFRARLQAWMDLLFESWTLDSPLPRGV